MNQKRRKQRSWRSVIWLIISGLVVISMLAGEFLMLFNPAP